MKTLTDEEKRIAVAVACGWKLEKDKFRWTNPASHKTSLPDYAHDLNAMREAEKCLGEVFSGPACQYDEWLTAICGHDQTWRATAEQRFNAFGKTLGLWT